MNRGEGRVAIRQSSLLVLLLVAPGGMTSYCSAQVLDGSAVLYPRLSPEAADTFSSLGDLTWLLIVSLVAMCNATVLCMSLEGLGREPTHYFYVSGHIIFLL